VAKIKFLFSAQANPTRTSWMFFGAKCTAASHGNLALYMQVEIADSIFDSIFQRGSPSWRRVFGLHRINSDR
jgi:hypothetical protein